MSIEEIKLRILIAVTCVISMVVCGLPLKESIEVLPKPPLVIPYALLTEPGTPEHATQRLMKETICPRRRIRTRWSEAAFRNGHLISISPAPPVCTRMARKTNGVVTGLAHVRRRLQFGRNPPKDRGCTSEYKMKMECPGTESLTTTLIQHTTLTKSRVTTTDSVPFTSGLELRKARVWRGLSCYTGSSRTTANLENSRSVLKPDSGYSLRSTLVFKCQYHLAVFTSCYIFRYC